MRTTLKNCLIWGWLSLPGCSGEKQPEASPIVHPIILIPAPEISPGDRPKSIRDARLFRSGDLVKAIKNKDVAKGDWVCVEGRVKHAGEMFGAFHVSLQDDLDGDQTLFCEGSDELRRYHFNNGINIIFHGRLSNSCVIDLSLISQQEVEAAISEETKNDEE